MRSRADRYTLADRMFGYVALFLIGLIGLICDRFLGKQIAYPLKGESQC
jgi:hypothetical protein